MHHRSFIPNRAAQRRNAFAVCVYLAVAVSGCALNHPSIGRSDRDTGARVDQGFIEIDFGVPDEDVVVIEDVAAPEDTALPDTSMAVDAGPPDVLSCGSGSCGAPGQRCCTTGSTCGCGTKCVDWTVGGNSDLYCTFCGEPGEPPCPGGSSCTSGSPTAIYSGLFLVCPATPGASDVPGGVCTATPAGTPCSYGSSACTPVHVGESPGLCVDCGSPGRPCCAGNVCASGRCTATRAGVSICALR